MHLKWQILRVVTEDSVFCWLKDEQVDWLTVEESALFDALYPKSDRLGL